VREKTNPINIREAVKLQFFQKAVEVIQSNRNKSTGNVA
jgi:hypothetical protein